MPFTIELIFLLGITCLIFYIVFISLNFIFGVFFFRLYQKRDEKGSNIFFLLISLFFFCIGIAYLFRLYFMFCIPTNFYDEIIYRHLQITRDLSKYHAFIIYLGYAFLSAAGEYSLYKKRTKFIFSIAIAISSTILIILPYELSLSFHIVPIVISAATIYILIITYLYLAVKHTGYVRKYLLIIAAGLFIFLIGQLFNNYGFLQNLQPEFQYVRYTVISPIMQIIGISLLYYGYKKQT